MRFMCRCLFGVVVFGTGFVDVAGRGLSQAHAQTELPQVSEATATKIRQAQDALDEMQAALEAQNLYNPAFDGVNPLAIMIGGMDAIAELEGDQGVDPFTFIALYSNLATDEVSPKLSWDTNGYRTYDDKVIRLYSLDRLKTLFHLEWGKQPAAAPAPLSAELLDKLTLLGSSLREAQGALEIEKRYVPAVKGLNPYAVNVGGLNAVADLERGLGVDPVTFAGLYAGQAHEPIQRRLAKDEQGRLTFDGRLIRLYPISRFKQLEAERLKLRVTDQE